MVRNGKSGESRPPTPVRPPLAGGFIQVFLLFSQIGLSSFGGSVAVWMHREFVERGGWLEEFEFASALAVARIMPGGEYRQSGRLDRRAAELVHRRRGRRRWTFHRANCGRHGPRSPIPAVRRNRISSERGGHGRLHGRPAHQHGHHVLPPIAVARWNARVQLAVTIHGWMTEREFLDLFAISRAAPRPGGLIAT